MQTHVKRHTATPAEALAQTSLPEFLQRVYANRGITDPADLKLSIHDIHSPESLSGISDAVQLLSDAIVAGKNIVIVGDYDADGATSTALVMRGLSSMGADNLSYLVPNRFEYGYGLTPEIVELCKERDSELIITVDNGISSIAGVQRAREFDIDVLITDHHLPGDELPAANVIVNPNLLDDQFPSKSLAGVGVIFYVLIALRSRMREQGWFQHRQIDEPKLAILLDLVALGTVADVVPLDRNNRIFVEQGLARIREGQCCPGIMALLEVAGCHYPRATSADLAFYIGPRINAAGRLEDMSVGIECLLADDISVARELALQLHDLNSERREIEAHMREQALKLLDSINDTACMDTQSSSLGICVYQPDWHQGVIGILAARLKEKYHRPTIAFASAGNNELKGSARSIQGVHIRDVLDSVATRHPGLITKFGGHAMAAGLSLPLDHYSQFEQAFTSILSEWVKPGDLNAEILSDGELNDEYLNLPAAQLLRASGPWGQAFPVPVFDGKFRVIDHRVVGDHHLKMRLQSVDGDHSIDAIAFNFQNFTWDDRADIVYTAYELDINHFRGIDSVQLLIRHLEVQTTH